MDIRVLGSLEVTDDGVAVELGSRRLRQLLAVLVVHANQVVSADRLVDLVESGHFFVGGSSPVASLQILDAVRRAAIVAAAPMPAYRPDQSSFRNTSVS